MGGRERERVIFLALSSIYSNALTYRAYRAQLRSLSIDLVLSSVRMGRGGRGIHILGSLSTQSSCFFCHGNLKTIELPLGDESPWIPEFYSHVKRGLAPLFMYVFYIYTILYMFVYYNAIMHSDFNDSLDLHIVRWSDLLRHPERQRQQLMQVESTT